MESNKKTPPLLEDIKERLRLFIRESNSIELESEHKPEARLFCKID
jgi:hypothetical protein